MVTAGATVAILGLTMNGTVQTGRLGRMRTIDADYVLSALSGLNDRENGDEHFLNGVETAQEVIANAPTIQPDAPKVMTLEEVIEHYSLPAVFPDDLGMREDYLNDIEPLYFDFLFPYSNPWTLHWRCYNQVGIFLNDWKASYGKKWRCWTARPTEEQRMAVKWE